MQYTRTHTESSHVLSFTDLLAITFRLLPWWLLLHQLHLMSKYPARVASSSCFSSGEKRSLPKRSKTERIRPRQRAGFHRPGLLCPSGSPTTGPPAHSHAPRGHDVVPRRGQGPWLGQLPTRRARARRSSSIVCDTEPSDRAGRIAVA
jgi:hypothetical protein